MTDGDELETVDVALDGRRVLGRAAGLPARSPQAEQARRSRVELGTALVSVVGETRGRPMTRTALVRRRDGWAWGIDFARDADTAAGGFLVGNQNVLSRERTEDAAGR